MDAAWLWLLAAAPVSLPLDTVRHPQSAKAAVCNGHCWFGQWQTDRGELYTVYSHLW